MNAFRNILLFILLSSATVSAQFYIDGIANDSIDANVAKLKELKKAGENQEALNLYNEIFKYWEQATNNSEDQSKLRNYYYIQIVHNDLMRKLKLIKKDDLESMLELENKIQVTLPDDKSILAFHFKIMATIHSSTFKDYNTTIDYLKRELNLYREQDGNTDKNQVQTLQRLGSAHRMLRKYDQSKNYFLESVALNESLSTLDSAEYATAFYELAAVSYFITDNEKGLEYSSKAVEIAEEYYDRDDKTLITMYRLQGIFFQEIGDIKKSLDVAMQTLNAMKDESGEPKKGIARYYSSVSGVYQILGDINKCIMYNDSAALFAIRDEENGLLPGIYHNKALAISDGKVAIQTFKQAIAACEKDPGCMEANYSIMLQNLGNEYYVTGKIYQAINYVTKAIELKESNYKRLGVYLPSSYGSMALISKTQGNLKEAISYQRKSLKTVQEFRRKGSFYEAVELSRLGRFLMLDNQLKEAEKLLFKARSIFMANVDETNVESILNNRNLSELFEKKSETIKSFEYIRKALKGARADDDSYHIILKIISEKHYEANNIDSAFYYLNEILRYSKMGNENTLFTEIPKDAFDNWDSFLAYYNYLALDYKFNKGKVENFELKVKRGFEMLDAMRSSFFYELSELGFQEEARKYYNWCIVKLTELYQLNNEERYLSLIFECMEKSKSIMINRSFARSNNFWDTKVPKEIIEKEKALIQEYNKGFDDYSKNKANDSLRLLSVDRLFELQEEQESLLKELSVNYPDYYQGRYNLSTSSFDDIKKLALDKQRAILQLHWADSTLYKFLVTPNNHSFSAIPINKISTDIITLNSFMNPDDNINEEGNHSITMAQYKQAARGIYTTLFEADLPHSIPTELTIIPDGEFVNFSFDILLNKESNNETDYSDLPYMLKDHVISYMGSATILSNLSLESISKNKRVYAGFGPYYKGDSIVYVDEYAQTRSKANPLLYNVEEVKKAGEIFSGDIFVESEATESNFIEHADGYRILHLAMHASINDEYPMESYLNFGQDTTTGFDGRLHVDEIAKLDISSDLIVLSACETNKSSNSMRKGLLGIARAFQQASCQNLVLTNWLIDDRSSSKIMSSFFQFLKEKKDPSNALREAKLKYLNSSSRVHAHPRYWAAFSYFGNTELDLASSSVINPLLLFGIGIIIILFVWFVFKKSRRV